MVAETSLALQPGKLCPVTKKALLQVMQTIFRIKMSWTLSV